MKELLDNLGTIDKEKAIGFTLIDTCYIVHVFEHHEKIEQFRKQLKKGKYAITSFNIEELMHIEHKLNKKIKEALRQFLKEKEDLEIIRIDVHPGEREREKEYIRSIEPYILKLIKDNSDGVLYATALDINADIITRDKHHLYNQISERFANKHRINIMNKIEK